MNVNLLQQRLIRKEWKKSGYSKKSLKYQKVLEFKSNKVTLLNTKHGILTYFKIGT